MPNGEGDSQKCREPNPGRKRTPARCGSERGENRLGRIPGGGQTTSVDGLCEAGINRDLRPRLQVVCQPLTCTDDQLIRKPRFRKPTSGFDKWGEPNRSRNRYSCRIPVLGFSDESRTEPSRLIRGTATKSRLSARNPVRINSRIFSDSDSCSIRLADALKQRPQNPNC